MAKFNHNLASLVLISAAHTTDKQASEEYGVSVRTIYNWRKRLEKDSDFAEFFRVKKEQADRDWVSKIPPAINACIEFLKGAAEKADQSNPDVIHSIAGALKILSDVEITKGLLDVRLANLTRTENEAV